MRRKWKIISELLGRIAEDDTLETCYRDLTCLGYAPNLGYRSWLFRYKGVLVVLSDCGNGHYDFYTAISWIDVLHAKLIRLFDRFASKT